MLTKKSKVKKAKPAPIKKAFRSAKTGKFVTKKQAEQSPDTTYGMCPKAKPVKEKNKLK